MASYEQTLKLFGKYLEDHYQIEEVNKVQSGHIRQYIKYLRERGKYTVVNKEETKKMNHPENRTDYKKEVSMTTIANYVRNIKVFFNYLFNIERATTKNPVESVENQKVQRKVKKTLSQEEIRRVLGQFDTTTFHGYRNYVITRIMLDTGMRIGECLKLQPEDFDFKHKSIHIQIQRMDKNDTFTSHSSQQMRLSNGCVTKIDIRKVHLCFLLLGGRN